MIFVKELVIRKTFTRFLLIISVWTGLNPVREDESEGLRLPDDEELDPEAEAEAEVEEEKDDVEEAKDPRSDIVLCLRELTSRRSRLYYLSHEGQARAKSGPDFLASDNILEKFLLPGKLDVKKTNF